MAEPPRIHHISGIDPDHGWVDTGVIGEVDGADVGTPIFDEVVHWGRQGGKATLTVEMTGNEMRDIFAEVGRQVASAVDSFRMTAWGMVHLRGVDPRPSGRRPHWITPVDWAAQRRIDSLRRRRRRRGVGRPGRQVQRTTVMPNVVLDAVEGDRYRFRVQTPDALDAFNHALDVIGRKTGTTP